MQSLGTTISQTCGLKANDDESQEGHDEESVAEHVGRALGSRRDKLVDDLAWSVRRAHDVNQALKGPRNFQHEGDLTIERQLKSLCREVEAYRRWCAERRIVPAS